MKFIYKNAQGIISYRELSQENEDEIYLKGICSLNGFRIFRKDRIIEVLSTSDGHQEKVQHYQKLHPYVAPDPNAPKRSFNPDLLDICFSGFKKADKDSIISKAKEYGFTVRSSITKGLCFLCTGNTPGQKKVKEANENDVMIINVEEFDKILEGKDII